MPHLLVIGSPSLDTLHLEDQTVHSPGGAGMYVSMAAHHCGAVASLYGPRPAPMPEQLQSISIRLHTWMGQTIKPSDMPRFEISHRGDKAVYMNMFLDAEEAMQPDTLLDDLSIYDAVHITALGSTHKQKQFFDACRMRGARSIFLGTFIGNIKESPELSKQLVDNSDVFFMNEEEAICLFGSLEKVNVRAGHLLFITRADKGAVVVQGGHQTHLQVRHVNVMDPTGAGETFCGAAIAYLLQGKHPVMAGRKALAVAAKKVEGIGPSALLRDETPPGIPLDERIQINEPQVRKISNIVKSLSDADPFNFISESLPPENHPAALDYFFAAIFQQFGFWETSNGRYSYPLIAKINGKRLKGSSYLFASYLRSLDEDPEFYSPGRQANLKREELIKIFRADDGTDPMPAFDLHLTQAQKYGQDMLALGMTPGDILKEVNASSSPLKTLTLMLDHISGYKEDPIRKKSNLLALSLSQRPEAFLKFGVDEAVEPVVDYHCLRSCLRTGLIEVLDEELKRKIANRELISEDDEWAVRYAAYQIQQQVEMLSGRPIGAVDWFFFNYTRSHCPEMTDPVCSDCAVDPVCKKRKEMFQPVYRTTNY